MKIFNSKLCHGLVHHRRYRPRQHALSYRVFSVLLDLDESDAVDRSLRMFAVNRPGLVTWWERDHGLGNETGLKQDMANMVRECGLPQPQFISIFCFPRVLGYVFNPLSVYLCRNSRGDLDTMVYEVNNTFGGRHFYIVPAGKPANGTFAHTAKKAFYVSPFNSVEGDYAFRVAEDDDQIAIGVNLKVDGRPLLNAYQTASKVPLSDRALAAALWTTPFMTLKVTVGIHLEAMKLWLKGLRITRRPDPAGNLQPASSRKQVLNHD